MKKLFMSAVAAIALLAPTVTNAIWGASGGKSTADVGTETGMTALSFGQILTNIASWLIGILGVGAIISFVVAGILYLTAAGDEAKTEKAKSIMTFAIIAVVVALVGYIAINLIAQLVITDSGSAL